MRLRPPIYSNNGGNLGLILKKKKLGEDNVETDVDPDNLSLVNEIRTLQNVQIMLIHIYAI